MLTDLIRRAASLGPGLLYALVALLSAGESAVLLDFVVPGEAAAIFIGAALAEQGSPVLPAILLCAAGAVAGDSVSFLLGRRYGDTLLHRWDWLRRRVEPGVERAERFVRRHAAAVAVARWVGTLRAVVPYVAGASGMRYRRFVAWDVAAALPWAATVVGLGYAFGDDVAKLVDRFQWALLGLLAAGAAVWWWRARRTAGTQDLRPR